MPVVTKVFVEWADDAEITRIAKLRGWDGGDCLLDYADEDDAPKSREFSSVTKAKSWAARNRDLDLWRQPDIVVNEYQHGREWDYKTVRHLRYVGDGYGWEEIE